MRALKIVCLSLLAVLTIATASLAQNNPSSGGNIANPVYNFGNREWMTVLILAFGIIIVLIEYLLLRSRQADKVDDLGKYLVITIIIIGTLALMVGSIDNNQTAPAVGLFGTIAGYLLGRSDRPHGPPQPPDEPDATAAKNGAASPAGPEDTADAKKTA